MACDLSIVVPVYNEQDNILALAQEVSVTFQPQPWKYELVFVDDASTDGTWVAIQNAQAQHPHVRGLRHAYNGGQSAALWTGIRAAISPIIATMDGDRQNDPADFPRMLAELARYDFVCGVRAKREDNWLRRMSAVVARRARKAVLRVDFVDTGCAMRVFKRTAVEHLFPFNGLHRFLPVLVHGCGAKTLEMPVHHRRRVAGVSKYGTWDRLVRGIFDLLAVAWYQRRRILPVPFEETCAGGEARLSSHQAVASTSGAPRSG